MAEVVDHALDRVDQELRDARARRDDQERSDDRKRRIQQRIDPSHNINASL